MQGQHLVTKVSYCSVKCPITQYFSYLLQNKQQQVDWLLTVVKTIVASLGEAGRTIRKLCCCFVIYHNPSSIEIAAIHGTINRSRLVVPDKSFHVCSKSFSIFDHSRRLKPLRFFSAMLNFATSCSRFCSIYVRYGSILKDLFKEKRTLFTHCKLFVMFRSWFDLWLVI